MKGKSPEKIHSEQRNAEGCGFLVGWREMLLMISMMAQVCIWKLGLVSLKRQSSQHEITGLLLEPEEPNIRQGGFGA